MGADLICTYFIALKEEGGIQGAFDVLKGRINNLTSLDEIGPEFIETYLDPDTEENEITKLNISKSILSDAVYKLTNYSRETALISIGPYEMLLTGGMSWGDSPTNIMESFDIIHYSNLYPYVED